MSSDPFRNYDMWLLSGNPAENDPCFDCPDDQCESCGLCTKHCECATEDNETDEMEIPWSR